MVVGWGGGRENSNVRPMESVKILSRVNSNSANSAQIPPLPFGSAFWCWRAGGCMWMSGIVDKTHGVGTFAR